MRFVLRFDDFIVAPLQALWLIVGIVGYWELVQHWRRLPRTKRFVNVWVWEMCEALLPQCGLILWQMNIHPISLLVFIVYTVMVTTLQWDREHRVPSGGLLIIALQALLVFFYPGWHVYPMTVRAALLVTESIAVLEPLFGLSPVLVLFVAMIGMGLEAWIRPGSPGAQTSDWVQGTTMAVGFLFYLRVRRYHEQLERERDHDPLTGLLNRRGFRGWVERHRNDTVTALAIDLDEFKHINDTYGHDVGDEILVEVSKRLQIGARPLDAVVRLGGDEFGIYIHDKEMPEVTDIAWQMHAQLTQDIFFSVCGGRPFSIKASVGAARGKLSAPLMRQADQALLQAKRTSKNTVVWFEKGGSGAPGAPVSLRWVTDAMRILVRNSAQGYLLTDRAHVIVDANAAFERMSGYSKQHMVGRKPSMFAARESKNAQFYADLEAELAQHGYWEGTFTNATPSGETWLAKEAISSFEVGGQIVGYWAVIAMIVE